MCAMILTKPSLHQMQVALTTLLRETEAKAAVLVDQDGRSIAEKGFTKNLDIDALSALIAGSFASTRALAKLVGESEFTVMFHQGAKDSIHNELVNDDVLLVVIFDDRTTIGMVRLYTKKACERFRAIFDEHRAAALESGESPESGGPLGDIGKATSDAFDNLFGEQPQQG